MFVLYIHSQGDQKLLQNFKRSIEQNKTKERMEYRKLSYLKIKKKKNPVDMTINEKKNRF